MAAAYKPVTHVIFDMDGLLLDTEDRYFDLTQEILNKFNKTYTYEIKKTIMGRSVKDMSEKLVEIYELPISPEEYVAFYDELAPTYMKNTQFMPGAERLVRHLTMHNVPCALGTSAPENMIHVKFTNHQEEFKLLSHYVSGSTDPEVKNGKPAPDVFLVAASRFPDKPRPENVLVFEDAVNGVQAARSAEMQVVMVPDKRLPAEDRTLATLVLDSLLDFKPEVFGLPPFPESSSKPDAASAPAMVKQSGAPASDAKGKNSTKTGKYPCVAKDKTCDCE